jgi:hypothetical protein
MSNIKQQLEAEAESIVIAHRDGGEGIHDLLAKHASERGYEPDVVRSLSWLVNRHNFKSAMANDHKDEIQLADAEAVLHRMSSPKKEASMSKAASLSPSMLDGKAGFNGHSLPGSKPVDYGPTLRKKLAARSQELDSEIKMLNASIRGGLSFMGRKAESVKRAGLDQSEQFQEKMFRHLDESDADIVEMVLDFVKVAAVPFTDGQFRMYAARAIADTEDMIAKAASVSADIASLADRNERRERVRSQMADLKQGWEV